MLEGWQSVFTSKHWQDGDWDDDKDLDWGVSDTDESTQYELLYRCK